MEGAVTKNAAQSTLATPIPARLYCDLPRDVILVVVKPDAHRPTDKVLDELAQTTFAIQSTLGAAQDIVAVGQETSDISGGVGGDIEDVPDVGGESKRSVLEGEAERRGVYRNWDVQFPSPLAL